MRRKRYVTESVVDDFVQHSTEGGAMKVTLVGTMAGPEGNARPGTVLDLPDQQAKEMLNQRAAREYDHTRDAKAPRGLTKARDDFEQ